MTITNGARDPVTVATRASKLYDIETLRHAERVSDYAFKSPFVKDIDMIEVSCIGLMHDLLENTDYDPDKDDQSCLCFDEMIEAVKLLTKPSRSAVRNTFFNMCQRTPLIIWDFATNGTMRNIRY